MIKAIVTILAVLAIGAGSTIAAKDAADAIEDSLEKAQSGANDGLKAIFQKLDADKDEKLSFEEFAQVVSETRELEAARLSGRKSASEDRRTSKRRDTESIFKGVDKNGDGFLSRAEVETMNWAKKNPDKVEKSLVKRDSNADGRLSFEEFKAWHEGKAAKADTEVED